MCGFVMVYGLHITNLKPGLQINANYTVCSYFFSACSDLPGRSTVSNTFSYFIDRFAFVLIKISQHFHIHSGVKNIPLWLVERQRQTLSGFLSHRRLILFPLLPNIQNRKCVPQTLFNSAAYVTSGY